MSFLDFVKGVHFAVGKGLIDKEIAHIAVRNAINSWTSCLREVEQ